MWFLIKRHVFPKRLLIAPCHAWSCLWKGVLSRLTTSENGVGIFYETSVVYLSRLKAGR